MHKDEKKRKLQSGGGRVACAKLTPNILKVDVEPGAQSPSQGSFSSLPRNLHGRK